MAMKAMYAYVKESIWPPTIDEQCKRKLREIKKSIRGTEREMNKLVREETAILKKAKLLAKKGEVDHAKVEAKSVVSLRKFKKMLLQEKTALLAFKMNLRVHSSLIRSLT